MSFFSFLYKYYIHTWEKFKKMRQILSHTKSEPITWWGGVRATVSEFICMRYMNMRNVRAGGHINDLLQWDTPWACLHPIHVLQEMTNEKRCPPWPAWLELSTCNVQRSENINKTKKKFCSFQFQDDKDNEDKKLLHLISHHWQLARNLLLQHIQENFLIFTFR